MNEKQIAERLREQAAYLREFPDADTRPVCFNIDECADLLERSITIYRLTDDCRSEELYCDWYQCSLCGEDNIAPLFSYCPDCGAAIEWHAKPSE